MQHIKTEAIILDATDIFDADRSLLLFTEALGKVRARAKGVRRPTSRLTGHLLPYLPTQLELIEGSGGWLVTQAQIVATTASTYPSDPIGFMQQTELLSEALNRLYVEGEPHPAVYAATVYTLERLRQLFEQPDGGARAALVTAEFLVKSVAELGYRPELRQCVLTGEQLDPTALAWSDHLGGVVNQTAARAANTEAYPLHSSRSIVVLREFLKSPFSAERLQMEAQVASEVRQIIYGYLQYQIGQPLKSLR